ncbi:phage tail tape measure protein [bacterium]|nr:phage tail tape measure protein [bacterium]
MSVVNVQTSADGYYQSIVGQANAAQKAVNRMQMSPKLNPQGFVQPLGKITNSASEFQKSMDASAARVFAFGAAVGVINGISDAFKSLISSAAEVEKSLKDIQVVMEATDSAMQKFGEGLFNVARNTASSFRTVAESATELARQGLSAEETLARVNSALVLSRLSGLGAVKSTETLTAAINSFNKEGINHEQIVNRMANVDAAFAVSSADLAEAISRAGAVAQSSGVEFNELAAIITAVQQRTARGGSVIGNGFKSIFTRIKRSSVREALEEIGVATKFVDGTFRSGIDIIKDYADTYRYLSDEQKAYTSEQIAGVYQIQNLQALIQDLNSGYSVYNSALDVANKTTNEATRRNEELNTTLSALFSQTSSSAKELAASIGELAFSDSFKDILTFLNNLAQSINGLFSETQGSDIAKTLVQGIGKFLTGPGLVIIGAAFIKIFALVGKFAKDAIADLLGLNREAKRQQGLQAAIGQILATNEKLYARILAASGNSAKQEQIILGVIKQATAERLKQEAIIKRIAASSRLTGVGAAEQGFIPVGNRKQRSQGKRTLRMANGFLPAINREEGDIATGVGGARKGDRALATKINVGKGKKIDAIVNSGEYLVKNFQGSGADAVFNRDMAREYGLPSGAKKFNAASGMIPSFSAGLRLNLSSGQKITIREGQRVNEGSLSGWIKDGAGVMTEFGFLSARQAGQARGGTSVKPWVKQGAPGSPAEYWTQGDRVAINKGALGGFQARNSKKNLEKQKQEREKKKEEMLTINARNPGGATMLISNKGIMGRPEDRMYTGEDGEKYRMLYNVHGLNLSGLKTGEQKIQERIKTSMINQAGVFADEASGVGKFARSNPEITRLTTPGSAGAAAGTIFETALRSIGDNKLFSQNIGDTFDIVRPPDSKLKKLFGNYSTKFADAKINDNSGNLMSFHKKLYTHFGKKARKERGAKNKQSGSKKGARNFSRGFLPRFTSFAPSFAGGFIPNFAKGETNKQQIERLKKAQRAAKKAGNTKQAKELGVKINTLRKTQTSNRQKNKKQTQKARQRSGGQAGSTFSVDFNKNSVAPSSPVSIETRSQRGQNRLDKRVRREFRRMQIKLSRRIQSGASSFKGTMDTARAYGSEGIKSVRSTLGNLSGKVGARGRLAADKVSSAATGGASGLKQWLQERKNIIQRANLERQGIREQRAIEKERLKRANIEASKQQKYLREQEKLSKSEERQRRSSERKTAFKQRVSGVVTSATGNAKLIAKALEKSVKQSNIANRISNVNTGFKGLTNKINVGGISTKASELSSFTSNKIKEMSAKVNDIQSKIVKTVSDTKSSAGKFVSDKASSFGKSISSKTKGIIDATSYMLNKESSSRQKNLKNTKENISEQQALFEKEEKIKAQALKQERETIKQSQKILNESKKRLGKGIMNPYIAFGDDSKSIIDLDKKQKEFNNKPKTPLSRLNPFNQSPEVKQVAKNMGSKYGSGAGFALPFVLPMAAQAIEGTGPREEVGGMKGLISNTLMGTAYGSFLLGTPMGLPAMAAGAGIGFATGVADYSNAESRREMSQSVREDASKAEMFQKRAQSIQQFSRALEQLDIAKTNNDAQGLYEANKNLRASIQSVSDPELSSRLISVATSGGNLREKLLNLNNAMLAANNGAAKYNKAVNLGKRMMDDSFDQDWVDSLNPFSSGSSKKVFNESTGEFQAPTTISPGTRLEGLGKGIWNLLSNATGIGTPYDMPVISGAGTVHDQFSKRFNHFEGKGAEATAISQDLLGYFRDLSEANSMEKLFKEINSGNREDLSQYQGLSNTELKELTRTNKQLGEIVSQQNDADFINSLNQLKETIINEDSGDRVGGKFSDSDIGKILSSENKAMADRLDSFLSGDDESGTTYRGIEFTEKFLKELDGSIESSAISMNFLGEEQKQLASTTKKGVKAMETLSPAVSDLTMRMEIAAEALRRAELMNYTGSKQRQVSEARQSAQAEMYQGQTDFLQRGGFINSREAINRNAQLEKQAAIGQSNRGRVGEAMDILNSIDLSVLGRGPPTDPGPDATAEQKAAYEIEKSSFEEGRELANVYKDFISSNQDGNITLDEIGGVMGQLKALAGSGNTQADLHFKKLQTLQTINNSILQTELNKIDSRAQFAKLNDSLDKLASAGGSLASGQQILQAADLARDYDFYGSLDPKSVSAGRQLSQLTGVPEEKFTGLSKAEADLIIAQENMKRFGNATGLGVFGNYKGSLGGFYEEVETQSRKPVGLPDIDPTGIKLPGISNSGSSLGSTSPAAKPTLNNPDYRNDRDGRVNYVGNNPTLRTMYNGDPYAPGGIFGPPLNQGETQGGNRTVPGPGTTGSGQFSSESGQPTNNTNPEQSSGSAGSNPFLRPEDYYEDNELGQTIAGNVIHGLENYFTNPPGVGGMVEPIPPGETGGEDSYNDGNTPASAEIGNLINETIALSEVNKGLSEINQGLSDVGSAQTESISQQTENMTAVSETLSNISTDFESLGTSVSEFSETVSESIQSTTTLLEGINETANAFSESMDAIKTSIEGFVENTKELSESIGKIDSRFESLNESLGQVSENIVGFPDVLKEKLESVVMQMQVSGEIKLNFNTDVVKGVLGPTIEAELKKILVKPMILDYLAKAIGPRIQVQNNSNF